MARYTLSKDDQKNIWSCTVPLNELQSKGISTTFYYGYRAWGPNWVYDPTWTAGSTKGFVSDVDSDGNRFNPNKLLLDPYGREVSHDPKVPGHNNDSHLATGPTFRAIDSGKAAPKTVFFEIDHTQITQRPSRPLRDDIIYEVNLRGLTMNDTDVPELLRGTYRGAALKAQYLKDLGVTAVEFLPVQETSNDANDVVKSTDGDNYWGYSTLNYFSPDRRYSFDKSPGGPTREFKEMVNAFHEKGIKVFIDVVYNHTAESGFWDKTGDVVALLSYRGLDNPTYYQLMPGGRTEYDSTGCGGNFNTANPIVRSLIVDSLSYWHRAMGVDGFRFDLAVVLGNTAERNYFHFDKMPHDNVLNRAVNELPVRPADGGAGVDLIAEPWTPSGSDNQQQGNFPRGWAEWNDRFRDIFRESQNKLGYASIPPSMLARRFAGSDDLFGDDGRKPWHSINFIVAHDGFTLRDLYSYNERNNQQPWPFGPSDGGRSASDERSWNQDGGEAAQRQAARTGLALLMVSAGVPMITGGDEMYRTQYGNNNAYNLDSERNWLDYTNQQSSSRFYGFAKRLFAFRNSHRAFRRAEWFKGKDQNNNDLKDITWLRDDGVEIDTQYWNDTSKHFLAFVIDGTEVDDNVFYVAYNAWSQNVTATLPKNRSGKRWYRVSDTAAWMEGSSNFCETGAEDKLDVDRYVLKGRSVLILLEK